MTVDTEVIRRRRMVRAFSDQPIPSEVMDRIVASALRAPSAGFSQGWAFLVLTEAADRARFWRFAPNQIAHTPTIQNAPLVIIPLAHKASYHERYPRLNSDEKWPAPYWYVDTGMAALLILLSAVDEGLDAFLFWLLPPAAEGYEDGRVAAHLRDFRLEFGIPVGYDPIGAIAVGYRTPDVQPYDPALAARRRSANELVHRGHWGQHENPSSAV